MIQPSWQLSAVMALCLAAVWAVTSRSSRPFVRVVMAFAREFALLIGVFAVYQHTAYLAHGRTLHAFSHARSIWDLERRLHLPSELSVQRLTAGMDTVERAMNWYYANMHLTVMFVFIIWMWWRHRERYALLRNTVAATTLICVLIQMVPVAPPRMFPQLGFVDTATVYGQSVYTPDGIADQLGAMPSIHVAWAGIVALFGLWVTARRWWAVFLFDFVTVSYVVVATANHWWLDGVAGLAVMGVVLAVLIPVHRWFAVVRARAAAAADPLSDDPLSDDSPEPARV